MQLIKNISEYDIPNDVILPLFVKRYGYVIMPSGMTGVIWSQYGPEMVPTYRGDQGTDDMQLSGIV